MTREEAIEVYNGLINTKIKEAFEFFAPELRDSEDERIRKALVIMIKVPRKEIFEAQGITKEQALAYLEKHKEPIDPFDTKLFQDGVKEGRRLEREDIKKEQKPAEWSEDKFPKDIEKDATQFCFDKGFNITPYQAKEIATHYLMIGHNFGYVEGRKNAHIPAKELGLPSSMDFKQEWSEEDELFLGVCKNALSKYEHSDKWDASIISKWLESRLKSSLPSKDCSSCAKHLEGYISGRSDAENKLLEQFGALITPEDELHIKPRWKPSEEQMNFLLAVINDPNNAGAESCHLILESLYDDLNKL